MMGSYLCVCMLMIMVRVCWLVWKCGFLISLCVVRRNW